MNLQMIFNLHSQPRFSPTWFGFFLLAILTPVMVISQPAGLVVEPVGGFDGYYRPGSWTPIFVDLDNRPVEGGSLGDLEGFKGQLMMTSTPLDSNGSPVRFMRSVDVPAGSSKRYILYTKLPETLSVPPQLALNSETGKSLSSYQLAMQHVAQDRLLLVNITDSIGIPNLPRLRSQLNPWLNSKLSPMSLPDTWMGWDSADMVCYPSWPGVGMTDERKTALLDWVRMGGTLIFLSGAETPTYQDEFARELLPVSLDGTTRLWEMEDGYVLDDQLAGTPPEKTVSYVLARSKVKRGTQALVEVGGYPLVARKPLGKGQVLFFALDLKASTRRLEHLIGPCWFSAMPSVNLADSTYSFSKTLPELKILTGRAARAPNQFIILIMCLLYVVVVGPLNFAILAKKKKLEWAWLTVPVIVLTFFTLTYGFGRLTKGGDSIFREISLRQFHQGEKVGEEVNITGIFVSDAGRYFLGSGKKHWAIEDPYNWHEPQGFRNSDYLSNAFINSSSATVSLSGKVPFFAYDSQFASMELSSMEMGIYDAKTVISRGPVKQQGVIDAQLKWVGNSLSGSIMNETEIDFLHSWLVVGGRALPLQTPFGEGSVYNVKVSDQLPINELDQRSIYRHLGKQLAAFTNSRPKTASEVNLNNVAVLLNALWSPEVTGKLLSPKSGVYFLGIHEEEELSPAMTNISKDVTSRVVATIVELDISPPAQGTFKVNSVFMQTNLLDYDDETAGSTFALNNKGNLEMRSSIGFFSFELPFYDPKVEITQLAVAPVLQVDRLVDEELVWSVYQFAPSPRWVTVNPDEPFLNENVAMPGNGRVYIRVESKKVATTGQQNFNISWDSSKEISHLGVTMWGQVSGR